MEVTSVPRLLSLFKVRHGLSFSIPYCLLATAQQPGCGAVKAKVPAKYQLSFANGIDAPASFCLTSSGTVKHALH